ADDRYAALDLAFAKLESRLRRVADRRKVKDTVSVRSPGVVAGAMPEAPPGLRGKVHAASPMPIDQALLQMELVGHDFYLFHDRDCDRFSVVYRRRGYDYGVIRLVEEEFPAARGQVTPGALP